MSQTEGERERETKKCHSSEHTQVPVHYLTMSVAHRHATRVRQLKKLYWEYLNAILFIRENSVLHLLLTAVTLGQKGKVRGDTWPCASWSYRADAHRAHTHPCNPDASPRYCEFEASSLRTQASISTNEWSQSENQSCGKGYIWPSLPRTAVKH